ncbi:hypothetical protein [Methylobacterium oxalidis]|uniref:hypothetical protein n=1 Tax=Methylobacterium oxalidis TaxID=944322 RepID=UPI003315E1D0
MYIAAAPRVRAVRITHPPGHRAERPDRRLSDAGRWRGRNRDREDDAKHGLQHGVFGGVEQVEIDEERDAESDVDHRLDDDESDQAGKHRDDRRRETLAVASGRQLCAERRRSAERAASRKRTS